MRAFLGAAALAVGSIVLGPVLLAPGPALFGAATPAYAATCGAGSGVSVVVDFRELGGGLQTACVPSGGGKSAASSTEAAGFPITWVQRQPGFVCRLSGVPANDPCVNTPPSNAYWGLYWSDGSNGTWTYSTLGAASLTVPDGGSVGFAWQGAQTGAPATAPPVAAPGTPKPSPTKSPAKSPTKSSPTPSPTPTPTSKPSTPATPSPTVTPTPDETEPSTTATASPTASPTQKPRPQKPTKSRTPRRTGSPSESATPTAAPTPTETPAEPDTQPTPSEPSSGQVPTWLVVALIALLVLAAAVAAVRRRLRGGG